MKKILYTLSLVALFSACKNSNKGNQKIALKNLNDSFSYVLGINTGAGLKMSNINELNVDVFMAALEKSLKYGDSNSIITQERAQEIYQNYIFSNRFKNEKELENKYFETLKNDKLIQYTPKGIAYKIIKPGNGRKPLLTDSFVVNMNLMNTNMQDILPPMKNNTLNTNFKLFEDFDDLFTVIEEGSIFQCIIHSKYAFKQYGNKNLNVPPYSTLVVQLELVKIKS